MLLLQSKILLRSITQYLCLVALLFSASDAVKSSALDSFSAPDSPEAACEQADRLGPVSKMIYPQTEIIAEDANIVTWLKEALQANEQAEFVLRQKFTDKLGYTHRKFQQTHCGYDVLEGFVSVQEKDGIVILAHGDFYPQINSEVNASITYAEAVTTALASVDSELLAPDNSDLSDPKVVMVAGKVAYHSTYRVDVFSYQPMDRKWVFVDIETGKIVLERSQISHITVPGEAHCFHHGTQTILVDSLSPTEFVLRDDTRGGGIITLDLNGSSDFATAVDFEDDDNVWDTTTDLDNAALDVHWATGLMYDYMLAEHGWNSYDNQGAAVISYIHHSNNFNANWNGSSVVYGDGNGTSFNPFTSAEVVGHELMHAYSNSMVGFNFSNLETRAVSEAVSDIFSVIVESNTNPASANYLIGDLVTTNGEGFRSLADPNSFSHPDTYEGEFWSMFDVNGMAGVLNHVFYLLNEGGTGVNDNGDEYTVSALSAEDVADIMFRTVSVYMMPSEDFLDFRTHGILACVDLFGACSDQEIQFTNACYAVGLGAAYDTPPASEIQVVGETIVDSELSFTSSATTATSWAWDFGDGTFSNQESPNHTYQSAGEFTVTSSLTYDGGCLVMDTINLTIEAVSSTVNATESSEIILFPTIANHFITLESQDRAPLDITIFDAGGRVVLKKTGHIPGNRINVSSYKKGSFYIHLVEADGREQTLKFIKL